MLIQGSMVAWWNSISNRQGQILLIAYEFVFVSKSTTEFS